MGDGLRAPSRTAVLTAVARDLYRQEPPPVILDDDLALGLAGEAGTALRERLCSEVPRSQVMAFSRWVCIRSRFAEDLAEKAVGSGVNQYVILGAGLDSFAYRRDDLMGRLRVFEVDHPASQLWKQKRLGELGVGLPAGLVFASVDFEHESLPAGLGNAGFDFRRPALFSWIGVTMYLTLDAINATLGTIAQCEPGTQVALTYNQPGHALDDFSRQVTSTFAGIATAMGEPFVSLFLPADIEDLLRNHGFTDIAHFGPHEARATYFDGRSDVEIAGAQRFVVGTVGPAA